MLVAELLFLLRITIPGRGGVGDGFFPDAAAAHEDLSLEELFALARFALHVVDGIAMFDVGIKAKNHKD